MKMNMEENGIKSGHAWFLFFYILVCGALPFIVNIECIILWTEILGHVISLTIRDC